MSEKSDPQFIIALGASSGGMQALNSFFEFTPLDGVAYVVVQHLSPDYKSRISELLSKHSKLEICEAKNNMPVLANKVYTIPSEKFMTIKNGKLYLSKKKGMDRPHMTINKFFESLAVNSGNKAIAIILSGSGDDGAEGIEDIKKTGGLVIAQKPSSALYDSMPNHAISTGLVDMVLDPEFMPQAIIDFVKNSMDILVINENEEKTLAEIIKLIKDHLPLDFTDYKQATLLRRIKKRAAFMDFNNMKDYLSFLQTSKDEIETLSKNFLISVTSFFRDPEAFAYLESEIIPKILSNKEAGETLKIWIAACATGQEVYSIAILVKEYLQKAEIDMDVKIFATDIDKAALIQASKGEYPENEMQGLSQERIDRFFTKKRNTYVINHDIRKMLIFAHHDLVKNPPYCNIDLISCRNLLIYMNPALQVKVLGMLHFGLIKGGYLFLGSSENANPTLPYLDEISPKFKIFQKRESKHNMRFDNLAASLVNEMKYAPVALSKQSMYGYTINNLIEEVNEAFLAESGYAGICIDENNNVLQTFGDLSKFLVPKIFKFNLTEMMSKELSMALAAAVKKSLKSLKNTEIKGIKIKSNNLTLSINLMVKPFYSKKTGQKLMLVFFSENKEVMELDSEVFDDQLFSNNYISNLEEELKDTKENLNAANENLISLNENLNSFNEEMQSANEEMQSTNEELQSLNEELQTINAAHQIKIRELTDLNDDLNNYFRSNVNGQIFVDNEMLLKRFSPASVKHINIRESDIGRPINNITTNIKFQTLVADIKEVLDTGKVVIEEIESSDGKWYQMMSMPYIRQGDGKQHGAIITFNDITALKRLQEELDSSNKDLTRTNEELDNFVYTASHDLLAPILNIEALVAMLKKKIDANDPDRNKFGQMIETCITKFKESLNDLSQIGMADSELRSNVETIEFKELLDDFKLSIQNKITETNARIFSDFRVKEIKFSNKNLRSIFFNLLGNAIKFKSADRTPEILVSTQKVPGYILLTIKDNGLGIPPEKVEDIFKMYKRLNHDMEGHGLGLYLVKKIVTAGGGKIEVSSEPGIETTFKIFFKL